MDSIPLRNFDYSNRENSKGLLVSGPIPNSYESPCKETRYQEMRGEWPNGLYSLRQVTEVKLGRVRSNSGWVTSEA